MNRNNQPLRVLMVEDNEDDVQLALRELARGGFGVTHERVDTTQSLLAALERGPWDLVISDYTMPNFSGLAALVLVHEKDPEIPVIFVSGTMGEDVAVAAMKAGAHDYFVKGGLKRLVPAVQRELREAATRRERKTIESALRESEERYRNVFEQTPIGIYRTTPDGRILIANPALLRMLGFDSLEDLTRRNLEKEEYFPEYPRSRFKEIMERDGEVLGLEAAWACKDGSIIHVRESARAIRDPDGGILYYEGTVEDTTERKKLEDQLRQSQKMEAIGLMAGGVAHDFNNLLNVITGFTEMAMDQLADDAAAMEQLRNVSSAAFRAAELTRKLLAFSRQQVLNVEPLSLDDLIEDFSVLLKRVVGEDVELRIVKSKDLTLIKGDGGQLEQVLLNLGTNARHAMPKGGALTIETQVMKLDEEFVAAHPWARPGDFVQLAVTDTGIGMNDEVKSHIFEPFFTTKPDGTGLGLSMVYGIVKQHNGFVTVYSEPDRGTTFHIYLPLETVPGVRKKVEEPKAPARGTETLLIAEDEDLMRELVTVALTNLGYNVLAASDGEEALRLFEANAKDVALAILDFVMPKMSGSEAYEKCLAIKPGLKAIFISGYAPESMRDAGVFQRKGVALVQKPFSPKLLAARVRELLDEK